MRYHLNAPGPFYVEDGRCIACMVPHGEAPSLMGFVSDPNGSKSHCFFKKQPATPEEVKEAISAVQVSCCGALRYGGTDPEILTALQGYELACDRAKPASAKPWWKFW